MVTNATQNNADPSQLYPFDSWLAGRGVTRTTGYRWRQLGAITTTNIFGRLYVSQLEIEKFERRALAGEFSKAVKTPSRQALVAA